MKEIKSCVLTIGDELLFGQVTDTNASFISQALGIAGFSVAKRLTVGDTRAAIQKAISECMAEHQVLVVTGGLGPTKDDLTKEVAHQFFGGEWVRNEQVENHVRSLFEKWGREPDLMNLDQALVPSTAQLLPNRGGTAPGLWFEHRGNVAVFLPGVPHEMRQILQEETIPKLISLFRPPVILHRTIRTAGTHESVLARKIMDWENALPEYMQLAYLPKAGQVALRITAKGEEQAFLESTIDEQVKLLSALIGEHIYSLEGEELEEVVGHMLTKQGATLATAESCTGGALANRITNVPGCSRYYQGGIVSYSNEVKMGQLGVLVETLQQYGAVSEQTACEMAENARKKYGADYALSTTGIAGPGGAVPNKPVGTVYIGYSDRNDTFAQKFQFSSDRMLNVELSCTKALQLLIYQIKKK